MWTIWGLTKGTKLHIFGPLRGAGGLLVDYLAKRVQKHPMSPFRTPKKATPEQALQQLKHFCGYRERCHEEVRERLKALGVWRSDQDSIIATLIELDYLNEERFARVFAGGKFRVNHWGRNRIKYALVQKKVSAYCIRKGLAEIEEEEYDRVLERLAKNKMEQLTGPLEVRRQKTITYLMGRGFEVEKIKPFLRD